ncbi:unnamed protein product, partial [Parnassius mnemosyne]
MSSKNRNRIKTLAYSQTDLESALKDIRERGYGIRETCKKYNIPRSTVQDRLSGKRTDKLNNPGPEPVLGISMEKEVVQWIIKIAKCGFPVKKQELLDTVQKILKDYQRPNPFKDDRPGQTWYSGFLKRNPEISVRAAESINKARARVTEEHIRQWFRELQTFLSESGQSDILTQPDRIFNADESGFSLCPKTGKVLGPKGFRNLYQVNSGNEKDNLTVLINFNAVTESMPPEWILGRSESGWMRSEIFFEYIVNDFNTWVENNKIQKPILLLVDGHKSHMSLVLSSMCEQLGIILYALPPNTTHILQPADVSVFAPLKVNWRKEVRKFLSKPDNLNASVTKTNFCQLFKNIIEDSQMDICIKNGFRKCGLFPFDPNAVDYTKCVQSTMERLNNSRNCEQTGITNQDLVSTRKVIRHLGPVLRKKNVDINFILREVKKLRKTEPRQSEVLYETGSEDRSNSTVRLSTSLLIDSETNLSKANPATITSMPHTVNPVKDSDPASVIDGSGLNNTHYADVQLLPPPIKENILLHADTSKDIAIEGCDKYNVSESLLTNLELKDQEAINNQIISRQDTTENINIETSLSSFHLSGSYLDQGTLVSLDDIVIIPLQSSTPTRIEFQGISSPAVITLPHVKNKESLTESEKPYSETEVLFKTQMTIEENQLLASQCTILADQTMTEPILSTSISNSGFSTNVISENNYSILGNTSRHQPTSMESLDNVIVIPAESTALSTNAFSKHLFVPEPLVKSNKNISKPRVPAAISSLAWRKHYEEKEKNKHEKRESIQRKKEASKRKKDERDEVKRRKTVKRTKTDKFNILGTE